MSIETELAAFIEVQVPAVAGKVYPVRLPPGAITQAVTYLRVPGSRIKSHSGYSNLSASHFQLDAWGSAYDLAKSVAQSLKTALDGYRGVFTVGSSVVCSLVTLDDLDLFDAEANLYKTVLEVSIWNNLDPT